MQILKEIKMLTEKKIKKIQEALQEALKARPDNARNSTIEGGQANRIARLLTRINDGTAKIHPDAKGSSVERIRALAGKVGIGSNVAKDDYSSPTAVTHPEVMRSGGIAYVPVRGGKNFDTSTANMDVGWQWVASTGDRTGVFSGKTTRSFEKITPDTKLGMARGGFDSISTHERDRHSKDYITRGNLFGMSQKSADEQTRERYAEIAGRLGREARGNRAAAYAKKMASMPPNATPTPTPTPISTPTSGGPQPQKYLSDEEAWARWARKSPSSTNQSTPSQSSNVAPVAPTVPSVAGTKSPPNTRESSRVTKIKTAIIGAYRRSLPGRIIGGVSRWIQDP